MNYDSEYLEKLVKNNNICKLLQIRPNLTNNDKFNILLHSCFWDNINIFQLIYPLFEYDKSPNNNIMSYAISEKAEKIIDYLLEKGYEEKIDISLVLKYQNKKLLNLLLDSLTEENQLYIEQNIKDFLFSTKIVDVIYNNDIYSKDDILRYFVENKHKYNIDINEKLDIIKKLSYYIEYEKREIEIFKLIKNNHIDKRYFHYTIQRCNNKHLTKFFTNQYYLFCYISSRYGNDIASTIYSFIPTNYN